MRAGKEPFLTSSAQETSTILLLLSAEKFSTDTYTLHPKQDSESEDKDREMGAEQKDCKYNIS